MQQSKKAVRLKQYDQDQYRTIQKQMDVGKVHHQLFFYNTENNAAQHGPPYRANAADHWY